jgi:hypothetical protein
VFSGVPCCCVLPPIYRSDLPPSFFAKNPHKMEKVAPRHSRPARVLTLDVYFCAKSGLINPAAHHTASHPTKCFEQVSLFVCLSSLVASLPDGHMNENGSSQRSSGTENPLKMPWKNIKCHLIRNKTLNMHKLLV